MGGGGIAHERRRSNPLLKQNPLPCAMPQLMMTWTGSKQTIPRRTRNCVVASCCIVTYVNPVANCWGDWRDNSGGWMCLYLIECRFQVFFFLITSFSKFFVAVCLYQLDRSSCAQFLSAMAVAKFSVFAFLPQFPHSSVAKATEIFFAHERDRNKRYNAANLVTAQRYCVYKVEGRKLLSSCTFCRDS
jgi:hypothetical protein